MLYHWAAPGYLFLLPLLARDLAARLARGERWVQVALAATALLVLGAGTVVATEVRWNWLPEIGERFPLGGDPDIQAVDWDSVTNQIRERGLLNVSGTVVAGANWRTPASSAMRFTVQCRCFAYAPILASSVCFVRFRTLPIGPL